MERLESELKWTRRMREPRKRGRKKKDSLWKWEEPSFFSSCCPTKKCLTNQRWSVYLLYIAQQSERTIKKKRCISWIKKQEKKRAWIKEFFNQIDGNILFVGSVDLPRVSFDCSFMFPYLVLLSWLLLLWVLQDSLILSAAQRQQKRGIYIEVDGREGKKINKGIA